MLLVNVFRNKGVVVYRTENYELEVTTLSPDDAMILAQILYRSRVNIVFKKKEEKEESGKRKKDWSRYISRPTLKKVEKVMKELGAFNVKDLMKSSGFSRTTIMRAIKVLREEGKIRVDERGRIVYLGGS